MRSKRLSGLLLLIPLLLTGCTSTPPASFHDITATKVPATPNPDLASGDVPPSIEWVSRDTGRVRLTMQGGVSCPPIPAKIEIQSPEKVILRMKTYKGVCTADTGPQTSEFTLPSNVSRNGSVSFTMTTTDPEPSQHVTLHPPAA